MPKHSGVTTLQSAATATGNGTALLLDRYTHVALQVSGTFSATVTWQSVVEEPLSSSSSHTRCFALTLGLTRKR